jgi:hypothetical protein
VFFVVIGVGMIVNTLHDKWAWFGAALGVYMLAQAFRRFAFSRHLAGMRQRLGVSMVRALMLALATEGVAGGLAIVGALSSLERVFGLIVAYGVFCYVWMQGWIVMRLWKERHDPYDPASAL